MLPWPRCEIRSQFRRREDTLRSDVSWKLSFCAGQAVVSWYYKIDDVEHGPISQDELVKMAEEGRLSPEDLVRNEKKKKWYKAGDVKGLKFPIPEEEPDRQLYSPKTKAKQAPVETSAEAMKLLKGFKKGGSEENAGKPGSRAAGRIDATHETETTRTESETCAVDHHGSGSVADSVSAP